MTGGAAASSSGVSRPPRNSEESLRAESSPPAVRSPRWQSPLQLSALVRHVGFFVSVFADQVSSAGEASALPSTPPPLAAPPALPPPALSDCGLPPFGTILLRDLAHRLRRPGSPSQGPTEASLGTLEANWRGIRRCNSRSAVNCSDLLDITTSLWCRKRMPRRARQQPSFPRRGGAAFGPTTGSLGGASS